MAKHGDILEVRYQHPTIGTNIFHAVSSQSNELDLGGRRSEDDENKVTTTGIMIDSMSFKRGSLSVLVESDNNVREDQRVLGELAADSVDATWTVTLMSGAVYVGVGKPVGEIKGDVYAGTVQMKIGVPFFSKV